MGDSDVGELGRLGGHGESLRRTRGEAAGEKLGASPVISPLLANVALSVLDEHFAAAWDAMGNRYADDFVVLVAGNRAHAESLRVETAAVLSPIGLRLSERKTTIAHRRGVSGSGGTRSEARQSATSTPTPHELH